MARKMGHSGPTIQSPVSIFLHQLVVAGFYDVLLALVRRYPYFAGVEFSDDESLLSLMAEKPSAFWSGTQLGSWQREVEKFVHPTCRTKRNSDGKTPKMVFTEEHKELVKEGEKWMKETANSCIFATVGFAASITVPGGNNQNSGFPLFFNNAAFTIFAVSVSFCLFSSVASVLMFLSILASRYAEEDLLKSRKEKKNCLCK
ncbi:hypothetical protein P3S67_028303 [Capsicum chacoense]